MAVMREKIEGAAARAARGNVIDRVVEAVNPVAGRRRLRARFELEVAREVARDVSNSGYSEGGASKKKSFSRGGGMSSLSPKEDINLNLPTLRRNSRSCWMIDPLARAALSRLNNFSIGTGLRLRSRPDYGLLGIERAAAEEWARRAEALYTAHFGSRACDAQGLNTGDELQALALLAWLQSGDTAGLLQYHEPRDDEISGLRVLLTEADRIRNPTQLLEGQREKLIDGVEIDAGGRAVALHVARTHPLSSGGWGYSNDTDRIPIIGEESGRRNVLFLIWSERPGQWRGAPFLAPIIEPLRNLGKYRESELDAAVVASLFTVFMGTSDPQIPLGQSIPDAERVVSESDDDAEYTMEMGHGNIIAGEPGQQPVMLDPKRPNANFDAFTTAITREIGAALGIPYEVLLANFTNSYSASRAALQIAWQNFLCWRRRMVVNYCQPLYEEFVVEQVLLGNLEADIDDPLRRAAWLRAFWYGPAMPILNPVQEVTAAEKRVANRFSTRTREAAEMTGMDFHAEVLPEQQVEEEELAEAGMAPLVITTAGGKVQPAPGTPPAE